MCAVSCFNCAQFLLKKQEKLFPECQKRSIEPFKTLEWNSLVVNSVQ